MMQNVPYRTLIRILLSGICIGLLAACTRERTTPTETPASAQVEQPVVGAPAAAEPGVTSQPATPVEQAPAAQAANTPLPAEASTPVPTPNTAPQMVEYEVKRGDTLDSIAAQYLADPAEIRKLNYIQGSDLRVGQRLLIPKFVPPPTIQAPPNSYIYKVVSGDSLSGIAVKFGIPLEKLLAVNNYPSADFPIRIDQELIIPDYTPTLQDVAEATGGTIYEVVQGDSLGALAVKFGVDMDKIIAANNLASAESLFVGQQLLIPGYQSSSESTNTTNSNNTSNPASGNNTPSTINADAADSEVVTHVVQPGEGLLQIAALYGISANEIAQANGILSPDLIRVGQTLTVPGITQTELRRARAIIHIVQSGETLITIAQRYGISAEEIVTENKLSNPNDIRVGQELMIPQ